MAMLSEGADPVRKVSIVPHGHTLATPDAAEVFRVVAERRGGGSAAVLPAPIRNSGVRGFAYPFALAGVVRLCLYDRTGTKLRTIAPGG